MARGFVYLAVVLDWATRRVLSWRLSITMEAAFCVETLEDALAPLRQAGNLQHRSGLIQSRRAASHSSSQPGPSRSPPPPPELDVSLK
jgi:transposase InsO family protein